MTSSVLKITVSNNYVVSANQTLRAAVKTPKACSYENMYQAVDRTQINTNHETTLGGDFEVDGKLSDQPSSASLPAGDDSSALHVNANRASATKVVDTELYVYDLTASDKKAACVEASGPKRVETSSDWWILVCAFLFNMHTGFNFSTYSVLYVPLTELFGSTRAAIGWIQSIEFALGNVLGLLVSYPLSIYGCRPVALIGSVLICVGGTLSSLAPNLALMYLFKAVIPGVGLSMCILANAVIIQQRFDAHRGLATGLSVIGFSLGNIICPPLVEFLLNRYSIRGTLAILGAIQAQRIPLALQLRTPKRFLKLTRKEKTLSEDESKSNICWQKLTNYLRGSLDFKLLVNTSFALFCLACVLQKFISHGYMAHTVNWAMSAGLPRQAGVWAVSVISMAALGCRVVVSVISDMVWLNRLILFAVGLFMAVPAMLPLIVFPGYASTFLSVGIFGIHNGITHSLISVVIVDLLGVKNVARAYALFAFLTAFPVLGVIPLIGMIYDLLGSYIVAFVIFSCTGLTSFALQIAVVFIEKRKVIRELSEQTRG